LAQATGLTLLEQDFESALAAMLIGNGEGVCERGAASPSGRLAAESGPTYSRERSPATSSVSTFAD
jgi:hypothetical protein